MQAKPGYPCWILNDIKANQGSFPCFGNCRILAYHIWVCEVGMIWRKLIAACKIHCKSLSRRPDGLTTPLEWFTVHEATLSVCIRESAYVRSHVGCRTLQRIMFGMYHNCFKRHKCDANKQDFKIKLNLTYQAQSTSKGILHL